MEFQSLTPGSLDHMIMCFGTSGKEQMSKKLAAQCPNM